MAQRLRSYGHTEAEFLSMTVDRLVLDGDESPQSQHDQHKPLLQRHARKSGAPIYAEVRMREIKFGSERAWLVLSTDITQRKALEEQLRHSQKMEAIGRLAGGIAHDFNNLLTVILGYVAVAQNKLGLEHPVYQAVSEVRRAAEHAATLTGQLLTFSRKQVSQRRVIDLNAELRNMEAILNRVLGEDIDLEVVTQNAPYTIQADPGELSQIVMNLAVNARDAMPEGGRLTIDTQVTQREQEDVARGNIRPAGRYCVLAVSDTGAGMDAHTQNHIFEPFFTTKQVGRGTGLGLSTVYGIVAQHNGWIDVYSELGHGTTFRIYFPASDDSVPEPVPDNPVSRTPIHATILVVEDQAALRMLAEDMLSEAGHEVLSASNGREALEVANRHNGRIDLLITDVVMPEMNGPDLADQLSRIRPGITILYVSGYTDHALLHRGTVEEGTAFLQKPFAPDMLVAKVAEVLQRSNRQARSQSGSGA